MMLELLLLPQPQFQKSTFTMSLNAGAAATLMFTANYVGGNIQVDNNQPVYFSGTASENIYVNVPSTAKKIHVTLSRMKSESAISRFDASTNSRINAVDDWDNVEDKIQLRFFNCKSLVSVPLTAPRSSNLQALLFGCSSFNQDISSWNVSHVTNMMSMFGGCSLFNKPLANWDVSQVTTMNDMFDGCAAFNQNLTSWNVSKVTDMRSMFMGCSAFNGNISTWDVSSVKTMEFMFYNCTVFNSDISTWNPSECQNFNNLFFGCRAFNRSIRNWNVNNVITMKSMLSICLLFNQNLSNMTFPKVTLANRVNYDNSTSAWLTANKPNFAIKT